jgi:hypothetical protein
MMNTRHLRPLPPDLEATVLAVVDGAREAAAAAAQLPEDVMIAAERAHPIPHTGFKQSRQVAAAGSVAASELRLRARLEQSPWSIALVATGRRLLSWDWDERTQAALNLRATFKDLPDAAPPTSDLRDVRVVAAWLTHTSDEGLLPATGRLLERLEGHVGDGGWFAVHGPVLLDLLAERRTSSGGRPGGPQALLTAQLRAVAVAVESTGLWTKREVAARAGVTRVTLNAWLERTSADPLT